MAKKTHESTIIQCAKHGACLPLRDRDRARARKVGHGGCNRTCPSRVPCCICCTEGRKAEEWEEKEEEEWKK